VEHLFTAALSSAGTVQTGDLMLAEPGSSGGMSMAPAIEPEIRGDGLAGYLELRSTENASLESASVALELAREPNAPTLLSGPLPVEATNDAGRRIAQGLVRIGDLPAGDYVARAVVSISGRPVARVVRAFTYAPTSEVRRRALVAGGRAAEGGGVGLGFEAAQVLQPQVVSYFLDRKAGGAVREVPSSAVGGTPLDAAIAAARAGRFDELASPAPSDADVGTSAFLQGLGLFSRGELEPAANAFRQALRADADFSGATFFLGACYAAGGKDREAVGAWQATLAVEDSAPFVYAVTADAHARLKEWEQAVDLAQEAAARWPDDARARMRLVRALALAGRRADALTALDAHLSTQPADPDILLLGMKVLYDAAADAQPVAGAAADRQRFERYLQSYRAAGGGEIALAERWLQVLAPSPAGR